jgi:hypothetical protein
LTFRDTFVNKMLLLLPGKSVCYLQPNTAAFEDPCPGSFKYLKVEYSCASE